MTKAPEPTSLSKHIGEPSQPYTRSKEITILPNEKDVSKKKKGYAMRVISIVLTISMIAMCLFFDGWLRLFAILPFLALIMEVLETIWYGKNMRRISNDSVWINRKAEIEFDEENHRVGVGFATERGIMTSFVHSLLLTLFSSFTFVGFLVLLLDLFFPYVSHSSGWPTTAALIMRPIGMVLALAAPVIDLKKPIPWSGKYICFKGPNGTLIYDSEKVALDAWRLEKKDN